MDDLNCNVCHRECPCLEVPCSNCERNDYCYCGNFIKDDSEDALQLVLFNF